MGPEIILLVIIASILGSAIGTFTGLVPGIHVNTLASLMLIAYPTMESAISGHIPSGYVPILVSTCIMSASVVHSFVDFVPSVFTGAPDPDDVASMLPGHRLLMQGRGMDAVRAAAIGSMVGACMSIALAVPVQYLMINGLADKMDTLTFSVLLFTLCVMVINEKDHRIWATVMILISGVMGVICIHGNLPCSGIIGENTMLFPLLTGMFGLPALMESVKNVRIPHQKDGGFDPVGPMPGIKGVVLGCLAGWFPGITATAGASLASAFMPEKTPERFISLVASIGTVTTVFSIVTLSISGSGRSGTVLVIKEIIGEGIYGFCSDYFILMLLSVGLSALTGYAITIKAGQLMSHAADRFDFRGLNKAVICLIVILVTLLTGPYGLIVLVLSTIIGFIPVSLSMSRIPLTGCLIVPVLICELSLMGTFIEILT